MPGERVFPKTLPPPGTALSMLAAYQGGVYRIEPHGKEAKVWIKAARSARTPYSSCG